MMKIKVMLSVLLFSVGMCTAQKADKEMERADFTAYITGTTFFTDDLEASVEFYTKYLGYKEYKRMEIDTPTGLSYFGVTGDKSVTYVGMKSALFSKDNEYIFVPGLNFVLVEDGADNPYAQDGRRGPMKGETMKAYNVKGLKKIDEQMRAANVPIVTPLTPSATGRSLTLTVIDPNGVRVQMYEYLKGEGYDKN